MKNVEEAFKTAMLDAGINTQYIVPADGKKHRFHIDGDKPGTKNGWAILYPDGHPAGSFGIWTQPGIKHLWKLEGQPVQLSAQDRAEIDAKRQKREIEQQNRQRRAAATARRIWARSKPITNPSEHQYLVKKAIQPHKARLYSKALVIPIYGEARQLVNLQFIDPDGTKRFLPGGRKKGCFSVIGSTVGNQKALICEGWATGASLHEDTGLFVVVALDAGNLEPVAKTIKALLPHHQLIIAGDNDESGTGQLKARAAALAVGGSYLIPDQAGKDWNDVLTEAGTEQ
ncbi:toprim domain-containing protein [Methylobacter sp. BlB1]|uniref:toprim domain-containing protein n=1 Tax=Methylobacter sp. BlB1 TaxID=2785914 RepID=UPI001893A78D|nr:toprim domain-containing protein [Methylobacter sp. BlB1]MBF6647178.1 toprim domain-containing protein [Methylobacter sp. BlB1]